MSKKNENVRPQLPGTPQGREQHSPTGSVSDMLGLRSWHMSTFTSTPLQVRAQNPDPISCSRAIHVTNRRSDSPLKVRKTRENLRGTAPTDATPLGVQHHGQSRHVERSEPKRQASISRRVFSKVKRGWGSGSSSSLLVHPVRSNASLFELPSPIQVIDDLPSLRTHSLELNRLRPDGKEKVLDPCVSDTFNSLQASKNVSDSECHAESGSPTSSIEPTPRPKPNPTDLRQHPVIRALVPHIILDIVIDEASVDAAAEKTIWIAVRGTVQIKSITVPAKDLGNANILTSETPIPEYSCGSVTSLRLCYKATNGCEVLDVIGDKTMKGLEVGKKCTVFVKARVPSVKTWFRKSSGGQDSLFTELESMVGTLETQVLSVEARYRHSLLPYDSVVSVRRLAKIVRPRLDFDWSSTKADEPTRTPEGVHAEMAAYVATHHSAAVALELCDRIFTAEQLLERGVREIRANLAHSLLRPDSGIGTSENVPHAGKLIAMSGNCSGACTPERCPPLQSSPKDERPSASIPSIPPRVASRNHLPFVAMSPFNHTLPEAWSWTVDETAKDEARQLWHHIRHSSLSTKQLAELASTDVKSVEQGEYKELQRRALANKRSVSAETLRAWKWELEVLQQSGLDLS